MLYFYLEENIKDNYQERPEEVEEEPLLNGFDVKGDREVLWDRNIDRGQNHHAGDVNAVDQAVLVLSADVVGGLVDDIHQDGGEVGHEEYLGHFPLQQQRHDHCFQFVSSRQPQVFPLPVSNGVLANLKYFKF